MTIVGLENTDIRLDAEGQPLVAADGDFATVSGDACWKQDLRLEAYTDEGELFYEDADGEEAYGFGLTDFIHAPDDEFTRTEISQRVRGKLAKRTYLDPAKCTQEIDCGEGIYRDRISVGKYDADDPCQLDLATVSVEVENG